MYIWSTCRGWLRTWARGRRPVSARRHVQRCTPRLEQLEDRFAPTVSLSAAPGVPVVLGSSANLTDSATLADGNSPSGYILFTLTAPSGSTVDAEIMTVTGNGTYQTPHGYLPHASGTYQWNINYSGDANNSAASDTDDPGEQAMVTPAVPTLTTSPGAAIVTLSSPAPTLTDAAILAGGASPTGTLTFTLYQGSTPVDTETTTVSGNGTYATPTGYTLPAMGTVTGTYQWNVSYSGDSNNTTQSDNNDTAEQVTVAAANPSLTNTSGRTVLFGSGATLTDSVTLAGVRPGGDILFMLTAPDGGIVDTEIVSVSGNGTYTTPNGYPPPENAPTGTYEWTAEYSGDGNNNNVSSAAGTAPELLNIDTPSLIASPGASTVTLAGTAPTLTDSATLSGGDAETGSLTFTLYQRSSLVETETVTVSGNGTYTTPTGYTLPTAGTVTGTYQWEVAYSGDNNNTPVSDNSDANEQVTVNAANPTLTASPGATAVALAGAGATLQDTATLAGGYFETGSLTFTLYQGSSLVETETATVSANGTYTTPTGYTLPATGTGTGTYQ
jgi:hypothetical protein